MSLIPNLETERLILRSLSDSDVQFIYQHFSDDDVCRYLYDSEPLTSIEEAQELIDFYTDPSQDNRNRWCIIEKTSGTSIGTCGFHRWNKVDNIAEIGYDLQGSAWGHGYMSEAMKAALDAGFAHMNLNRIEAFTYVENERSVKLLERLGFMTEGVVRDKHLFRGTYYDHFCCSILRREWIKG